MTLSPSRRRIHRFLLNRKQREHDGQHQFLEVPVSVYLDTRSVHQDATCLPRCDKTTAYVVKRALAHLSTCPHFVSRTMKMHLCPLQQCEYLRTLSRYHQPLPQAKLPPIDVRHSLNLIRLLFLIVLVDANSVYPQHSLHCMIAKT
jgi:hypothetical protein